jgi:hypothetical protein
MSFLNERAVARGAPKVYINLIYDETGDIKVYLSFTCLFL